MKKFKGHGPPRSSTLRTSTGTTTAALGTITGAGGHDKFNGTLPMGQGMISTASP